MEDVTFGRGPGDDMIGRVVERIHLGQGYYADMEVLERLEDGSYYLESPLGGSSRIMRRAEIEAMLAPEESYRDYRDW